ncbi:MAG: UDP-N-acetylmuramoyl-tripeptide--D-alanyl-D-alanine ligase [Chitinophagaceae bacterium]|nr:UDP-N-acetylmuramoyl-tripeptide--D-alanyl-D-alanine ligase [Chitinophagaceae bacterium]
MNIIELYEIYKQYPNIQTDTRKLQKGDLFFALRGPNFNANAFAEAALDAGAAFAVIDDASYNTNGKMILVNNALDTLQQLALYHRNQFKIPFIAITGSNGKTTTKELVHAVLSSQFNTCTTTGNLNNHIGVPLTILKIRNDAEMAVIEMGANHRGEIASYCEYTRPTHGLITNVGKAHLEGFGGYEGVKKGKGELFDYLRSADGTAFVMWDYEYLREMSKGIKKIYKYGTKDADTIGKTVSSEPFLSVQIEKTTINTQLVGAYNFPNILAAAAIGNYFGIDMQRIKSSIEGYAPSNSRSQLIEKGSNKIILDAYNANPSSMRAAIENFEKIKAENKVLILGAMAELGEESLQEHEQIIQLLNKYSWKDVVLVGGDFLKLNSPFKTFDNSLAAKEWYTSQKFENSYLLIKGSRSMQMEKVLEP